jgi:hypothetical protein
MRALAYAPVVVLSLAMTPVSVQVPAPLTGTSYRVYLTTGEPLPSYGEPVVIGDRVIFNLLLAGHDEPVDAQLVSLPVGRVDRERTERYTLAMRGAHYAATRGEADYAALTAEVARVLDQLTTLNDARARLRLAEAARQQLLDWADDHYQYRQADIAELASLFDEVMSELRIALGEPPLELALVARVSRSEPLLPAPTLRESVALALSAAAVADVGAERVGILRRAAEAAERMNDPIVAMTIGTELAAEVQAGEAYAALLTALRERASAARARGDTAALAGLIEELERRDSALGERRPAEVQAARAQFQIALDQARAYQAALAAYQQQRAARQAFSRRLRPLLDRFGRLEATLEQLRDMAGIAPSRLDIADAELMRLQEEVRAVRPPDALTGVHAMIRNAIDLARRACERRRQALSSRSMEMREASSAAAGALLLASRSQSDLEASLKPPVIE